MGNSDRFKKHFIFNSKQNHTDHRSRLSTIREADEIIFLNKGRIIEKGHHQELISKGGEYANFCKLQDTLV